MIARPKISRNERETTERGAFEVGNFAPFSCPGLAQLSPILEPPRGMLWHYNSGYHVEPGATSSRARGMGHTALSGTGLNDGGDFVLRPCERLARLDHGSETARPGFYAASSRRRSGASFRRGDGPLVVAVGLSHASAAGAAHNAPPPPPLGQADAADAAWAALLGRARVRGDDGDVGRFYTALYHAFLGPTLFSDADGSSLASGAEERARAAIYSTFSLWDTYRAAAPLGLLLEPERAADYARSLLAFSTEAKVLPRWVLFGKDTGCARAASEAPARGDAHGRARARRRLRRGRGRGLRPAGAFEEGTPLQYTFMVPGDAEGLAALLGGPDALGDRLDDYFLRASMADPTRQLDLTTGTIGGHCQGNEPGHHAPYLYNVANRPWRTAETIDAINELYTASEIPGNDDVGQTSAWFAWSALGLYPVDPCGDRLHLGKPLFMRADVDVRATLDGAARALTILGDGCRDRGAHVQSVWFEGSRVAGHEVAWADVANGGVLRFVCGAGRRLRDRAAARRRGARRRRPRPAARGARRGGRGRRRRPAPRAAELPAGRERHRAPPPAR
ncbi:glycosyl hydrolase [Aureococcus anophagefferens]|nr:glycosyl hydrolase [Aureococcus anophagefferens]